MDTENPKKLAIIHRDTSLTSTISAITQHLGYVVSTLIVNRDTTPYDAAGFVDRENPNLVFLAENFTGGQFDPDPTMRGDKRGEGIEALIEIRRRHPKSKLPIYMVSGGSLYWEKAIGEGANGYFDFDMVRDTQRLKEFLDSNTQS